MPWKAPFTPNKPAFCHLPLPGPLLWGPMAQSVSKNTRLGQTRAGTLSGGQALPWPFARGQFQLPRHSVSFIRMGRELAATDPWTHSITAGMKAEKKVTKELPFLSIWDGERSGQWVQCWTPHRQPKETGHKALPQDHQGQAHKGDPQPNTA